jgi:transposase
MEAAHPNAAGIDIGTAGHFVAIPPDRNGEVVREFSSFTEDLEAFARWLTENGVDMVAMEATGVYWIPLYELHVSGRKSDVLDCQWLQQLMSYGLWSAAFRPKEEICVLRSVTRQLDMLTKYQTRHVQHTHKALTQMRVQLDNVISDVAGETRQKIIRAILAGERDPLTLARLRNARIRAREVDIVESLQGNWRSERLFARKQAMDLGSPSS